MKNPDSVIITMGGKKIRFKVLRSETARTLLVRAGPRGMEVVQSVNQTRDDVTRFLHRKEQWILSQNARIVSLASIRRATTPDNHQILYRGKPIHVQVEFNSRRQEQNKVILQNGSLIVRTGPGSRTLPVRTLENWLRKEARTAILAQLETITKRLKRSPGRVYVMSQRTKWGNCSSLGNLSFNWRLIMAPDEVLRYLVIHEAVHLVVPDHSHKFWLTVQSLCPETMKARQWLSAHDEYMLLNLRKVMTDQGSGNHDNQ